MKESWEEWDELCQYVKREIMQYDDNMKIPKYMILRLRGLQKGQFIANNNIKPMASYSSKIILLTFKYKKIDILNILRKKIFKDEKHKFNYIMAIIESNINDVYLKYKVNYQQKNKIKNINIDMHVEDEDIENIKKINTYQTNNKKIKSNLKHLW